LLLGCTLGAAACTQVTVPPQTPSPQDALSVSGEGQVTASPDVVVIQLGVETRSQDAKVAVEEANKRVQLLISNLRGRGIAPADMQTSDFSVNYEVPPMPYPPPPPQPEPRDLTKAAPEAVKPAPRGEFRVNNTLRVKIRNVEQTGELLGLAIDGGANNIWGITFTVDEPKPMRERARAEAVADALRKAQQLASASGVKLGRVLSIDDQEMGGGGPVMMEARQSLKAANVPVEAGSVELTHRVLMRFELLAPKETGAAEAKAAEPKP
jgi:uncharacterized protein YggE